MKLHIKICNFMIFDKTIYDISQSHSCHSTYVNLMYFHSVYISSSTPMHTNNDRSQNGFETSD